LKQQKANSKLDYTFDVGIGMFLLPYLKRKSVEAVIVDRKIGFTSQIEVAENK
jgi:hypothetical protein